MEEILDLADEVHDLEVDEEPEENVPLSKGVRALPVKTEVSLEDFEDPKHILFKSCLTVLLKKVALPYKVSLQFLSLWRTMQNCLHGCITLIMKWNLLSAIVIIGIVHTCILD